MGVEPSDYPYQREAGSWDRKGFSHESRLVTRGVGSYPSASDRRGPVVRNQESLSPEASEDKTT